MLSLLATGLTIASLEAFAVLPIDKARSQITIPKLKGGAEFTLEGMYLQPNSPNVNYANVVLFPQVTVLNPALQDASASVKPKANLGFGVGTGYEFSDSSNDVQLYWNHFDHTTSGSTQFPAISFYPPEIYTPIVDASSASSETNFKYDSVDLNVGQYINMGTRLQTRLFGGLRYASLKNDIINSGVSVLSYSSQASDDWVDAGVTTQSSKFTGIGPRLGFETTYNVGDNFSIIGLLGGSLLVGQEEAQATAIATHTVPTDNALITTADTESAAIEKHNHFVPAVDAKLGANYFFSMNATSSATIEAGYKATEYFGAIDRVGVSARAPTDGDSESAIVTVAGSSANNIGFNGPYLGLNIKM